MINVSVRSEMLIAKALGSRRLEIELPDDCDILGMLLSLSEKHGDEFRSLIFSDDGEYRSDHNIILHNGRSILAYDGVHNRLRDGDEVVIMPLVAGG